MDPRPLAALITPNMMPTSILRSRSLINLMIPTFELMNPPAKKPYRMLKIHSKGSAVDMPQNSNTATVAPTVEKRVTVVTCKRSHSIPMNTVAKTAEALIIATSIVPIEGERPSEVAKDER